MHITRTGLVAVFAVLTTFAGPPALSVSAQTRLASAKTMRCALQRQSTGTWGKDGVAAADVKPASLTLRFESIDSDAGTAQLRNGAVSTEVTVRFAEGYLHFMQAFRTGPLYTTTVFEAGATGGKYKAVHSRHEYFTTPLPGATSSPEQYYGECEAGQ
jgi:hypothetical protein